MIMATQWLSIGIGSFCLNNGITRMEKFPRDKITGNNKFNRGIDALIATRTHLNDVLETSSFQKYWKNGKICAAKVSTEMAEEEVSTTARVDELKEASSFMFRTKSGALVKVRVEKKIGIYEIRVYVSALQLSGGNSRLVMVWGVYRSDSASFLPLDLQNVAQDSETQMTETLFLKSSSTDFMAGLEFDGKESPFYLSFLLKSFSDSDPDGAEIRTHRDTDFCVPVGFNAGRPLPLGLSVMNDSLNFSIFSRNSKNVVLCLYDGTTTDKPALELDLDPYVNRTGDVWHASIENTWNFVSYGYRCKENARLEEFNLKPEQILVDPYTKTIAETVSGKYLGRLSKETAFEWGDDASPRTPLEKLAVYRLNVKQFTQHESSKLPADVAGSFSGLAEKVDHLISLGINAVLLEPIFAFYDQKGPYFPFHFFSPAEKFGPFDGGNESAVNSMKEMVKILHSHGIEVFLEVNYTFTADSGALHGIDDASYYHNDLDSKIDLNCNYPVVQELILESLRYWVIEFHVDAFCFVNASSFLRGVHGEHLSRPPLVEAIAFDPILGKTKLVADCWDPRDMAPEEIRFPHWKRWGEMNTKFCYDVRNFVRGGGLVSDLATRLCGSGDIVTDGRGPAFSFNFVSRNSGLSLVDLVSFSDSKLASEISWNCGEEGPTRKPYVLETRLRQIRNFLFILYVSLGIPVLNMGDECGLSCGGSPLYESRKPFDWNMLDSAFGIQITQFIAFMTSLRSRRSDVFQRRNFLKPECIKWYASDQSAPKWEDPASKLLAMGIKPEMEEEEEEEEQLVAVPADQKGDLFIVFNASNRSENVILPSISEGNQWRRFVDTGLSFPGFFSDKGEIIAEQKPGNVVYEVKPYSCTLFESSSCNA